MPYADYYYSQEWYARCDSVKSRARYAMRDKVKSRMWYVLRGQVPPPLWCRCEYCFWRPVQQVHHRSYDHFRNEPLADLMAVCDLCHRVIHGLLGGIREILGCRASLLGAGDTGMGMTPQWEAYLATFDYCTRCEHILYGHYRYNAETRRSEYVRGVGLCGMCALQQQQVARRA